MAAYQPQQEDKNPSLLSQTVAVIALLVGIAAVWAIRDVLMLTLTAVIVALLLTTPLRWLMKRGVSRPAAVIITLVTLVTVFAVVFTIILPQLLDQFERLIQAIPSAVAAIQTWISEQDFVGQYPQLRDIDLNALLNQVVEQAVSGLGNAAVQVFPFLGTVASTLVSVLVVLFMVLYMLVDPGRHVRGVTGLIPSAWRARAQEIMQRLAATINGFLQAQIATMIFTGIATYLLLLLMQVPLAAALATITGLFSFVPNFGPLVALLPTVAISMLNTPESTLWVIVLFYAIQLIQSQVVGPMLVSQEINMPPLVVLLSQIVGGIFFGFLGLLLALPLAAIALVLVDEIYVKEILGEKPPPPPPFRREDDDDIELLPDGV
jgi:predicted PurR-regulated permease PerM